MPCTCSGITWHGDRAAGCALGLTIPLKDLRGPIKQVNIVITILNLLDTIVEPPVLGPNSLLMLLF